MAFTSNPNTIYNFQDNEARSNIVQLSGSILTHSGNPDIHVTASDKSTWNAKANSSDIKNSTITITQGGVTKGTFTLNQSNDVTIALDAGGGGGGGGGGTVSWGSIAGTLSNQTDLNTALNAKANSSDLTTHTGNSNVHVTSSQKSTWNAKANTSDIKNSTITIKQGTVTKGTFTTNQSSAGTITLDAVPTTLAALTDDSTHRLVTDTQKSTWNGKAASSHTHAISDVTNLQSSLDTKAPSSTAVTHTASTAAGNTTTPVYVDSTGKATALSYSIAKSVPSDAKFTDTVTTVSTTGSGNAVTSITASNGALTVTKGSTFALSSDIKNSTITLQQGGVTKGTFTLNQASNATINFDAGGGGGGSSTTIATLSSVVAGATLVPDASYYIKMDANTTLNAGTLLSSQVGAAELFINPGSYTFTIN